MNISYIFLALALLAEIIGTVGGFGSSVFFVPIGNFYFDFYSVLGLTAVFHLSSNLSKILLFRKGLNKQLIVRIGIPSVIMVIVGGYLSSLFEGYILEIILGCFLISLSSLFLIKKDFSIAPNIKESIIGGSLSGFSSGILGTGGAIRGLTMAAFNLEKSIFIATSAFIDFMVDLSRTVVYYQNGYIHDHDFIYIPFLFAIGIGGTYIGKKILNYIPQEQFKRISLILILLIGLVTIGKVILQ
ncbi:sulfite exporter TauE/SafE family protein [Fulvivirga lutea]|uniref:Probable membrane transporter protein n=1 Tax=Fulvivirga lutea TaxID=2810512 RepID=A0A974WES8_9BACT|nr:sulfite exporter TauE/SafE family protein [Fulvivirga lutea]QSE97063.1 sulfite exporter TauE/SafE family protein [Fulvivirga lutea]